MDLFNLTQGIERFDEKPRDATPEEVRAYLRWLADKAGVIVPNDADYCVAGIYTNSRSDGGRRPLVPMPGYGQPRTVTVERLDDAGNVIGSSVIGLKDKGAGYGGLGIDAQAVRAMVGPIAKPARKPVQRRQSVPAPSEALEAPIALPAALPAPIDASATIMDRLARLEAAIGLTVQPKRTERHAAAIRRAWAMRKAMRAQADLDRRALLASREHLERIEAARVAAVQRARADEARAIDAETAVALACQDRDEALRLAAAEETRANSADRSATAVRLQLRRLEERADRLARVSVNQRRATRAAMRARDEARADTTIAKACERAALRKLSDLRAAVDSSPAAAKVIGRQLERAVA